MITVCNRLYVHADYHEAFEQRFAERESLVDQMEGFISFRMLRPTKEDAPYVVMTVWRSHAHFQNWLRSDEFKQQHRRQRTLPPEALTRENVIEIHEMVQNNGPIPVDA